MESRHWITLLALYVWVYYAVARSVMRKLQTIDPDYYYQLGTKPGIGMNNSIAVGRMLFDRELPKQSYPISVCRMITLARNMLFLSPFVVFGVISLAIIIG